MYERLAEEASWEAHKACCNPFDIGFQDVVISDAARGAYVSGNCYSEIYLQQNF